MTEPVADFILLVTVRVYGRAVADDAVRVLQDHPGTFDLPDGSEAEIIDARYLGNDHYVTFTEDRWTVEHSAECRLSGHMNECAWHEAVDRIADEYDPDMLGRWRITAIDSEGMPSFERAQEAL